MTFRRDVPSRSAAVIAASLLAASPAFGQDAAPEARIGLLPLFLQSLDIFTVLLVLGSLVAVGLIARCAVEIRDARILPKPSLDRMDELLRAGRIGELRSFVQRDESFPARVLAAALAEQPYGPDALRDAAEMEASAQSSYWFHRIELLGLIGNLGPLIGLAGTVWGMIIAFIALGEAGGDAGPEALSAGIAKALFHTLLGLLLAIPCLLAHGHFRAAVDRICTRGTQFASRLIERLPPETPASSPAPTPPDYVREAISGGFREKA